MPQMGPDDLASCSNLGLEREGFVWSFGLTLRPEAHLGQVGEFTVFSGTRYPKTERGKYVAGTSPERFCHESVA